MNREAVAFKKAIIVASCALLAGVFSLTHAQQTIFNVPTTDVLDRGKVYAELDVSFKPNDAALVNKFSSFVSRVVVGAGSRAEIGLNVTGNIQPGPDSTTPEGPTVFVIFSFLTRSVAPSALRRLFRIPTTSSRTWLLNSGPPGLIECFI